MHSYGYKSWQTVQQMIEKFFLLLPQLVLGIAVFIIFVLLAFAVRWVVERFSRRYRYARNLGLVLGRMSQAFAFRDILQNFLAGIILLLHEPFRLGDQIKVDEFEGTVEAIESRATIIKTYDGLRVVIPNAEVFTKSVTVNTAYEKRRSEHIVGIGYGDEIETAKQVILDAVKEVQGVMADPAPDALAAELVDFSVQIKVSYWFAPVNYENLVRVHDQVISVIKQKLNEVGIDMPYPTHQILFHDQTEETDGDRSHQRGGWPARQGNIPQPRSVAAVIQKSLVRNGVAGHGEQHQAA
jgi:small conductance mechanosensitive channel